MRSPICLSGKVPAMTKASLVPSVLIDARELARMLSVSVPTVWRMRESCRLPEPLRLTSQTVRWRRADIESWLAAGCPSSQEAA